MTGRAWHSWQHSPRPKGHYPFPVDGKPGCHHLPPRARAPDSSGRRGRRESPQHWWGDRCFSEEQRTGGDQLYQAGSAIDMSWGPSPKGEVEDRTPVLEHPGTFQRPPAGVESSDCRKRAAVSQGPPSPVCTLGTGCRLHHSISSRRDHLLGQWCGLVTLLPRAASTQDHSVGIARSSSAPQETPSTRQVKHRRWPVLQEADSGRKTWSPVLVAKHGTGLRLGEGQHGPPKAEHHDGVAGPGPQVSGGSMSCNMGGSP